MIDKKYKLLSLFRRNLITERSYKFFRNTLNSLIKKVKKLYFLVKLNDNAGNCSKTWNIINNILNRKTKITLDELEINNVKFNGVPLTNKFNDYFSSIGTIINNSFNDTDLEIISNRVAENFIFEPITACEIKTF